MLPDKLFDGAGQIQYDSHERVVSFLRAIFQMMFWKDYVDGHIPYETVQDVIELLDQYVSKTWDDGGHTYEFKDEKSAMQIIQTIRDQLNLQESLPWRGNDK